MATITTEMRIAALAKFLACDADELSPASYDEKILEYGSQEYLVLTDAEADDQAEAYIADSLWAFNASFLASETELPEECFTALCEKCENGNDPIRRIVDKTCGLKSFVDSAVSADGRGHFLSQYDGEENEQGEFFIYRCN